MKMKIRDFIHENVDIDVCDDYTEECNVAYCGPMWLTPAGEQAFAGALDLEVEVTPGKEPVIILVDDPDEEKAERNLREVYDLFHALAGECGCDDYDEWFLDHEPEQEQRTIWLRLGVCLKATPQEIDTLLADESTDCEKILWKAFREGRMEPGGDTYIPAESVEDYNSEYGTEYAGYEVSFYL